MHDFKIWILIIWICLYFYCVQNPLKDWHGITRQDNLIGDMTWNSSSSSKHDCIALPGLHCTPAKYQLCQSAGQLSVLTCTYPETWVHGTTGPRSSCLLSTGCLQISTGLSMFGGRFYILTVHIFHIDICSDHSLDNLLIYCLPTSKLKLWFFVKINNDEHFYL